MKVDGTIVSIVDQNVSIDGSLFTGTSHDVGLKVTGSPAQAVRLDSKNNCVHFETNNWAHPWNPGYYHNVNVNVADTIADSEGVCGSPSGRQPVLRKDALFSDSELDSLCQMCGMSNCIRRLGGRRLEMSQPQDWIPAANADEACKAAGIPLDVAAGKCQTLRKDTAFFHACMYDYCASDGDDALVKNAVDSKQREVERSQIFKAPAPSSATTTKASAPATSSVTTTKASASSSATTTKALRAEYTFSSAQTAAPLSALATSVAYMFFFTNTAW